jgi:PAS domain S-box-containing protein
MAETIRILYIDDNPMDRALVRDALEKEQRGFVLTEAKSKLEFEKLINSGTFDLVLTDFNILGFEGLQVLEKVKSITPGIPVIIVTGTGSEEVAVEAMKQGASDYIIKTSSHLSKLPITILAILESRRIIENGKIAEENLTKERKLLRTLIDNLPYLIYVKDIDCRKVIANLADVKNIGFIKEEVVLGKTDLDLFPEEIGRRGYLDDKKVISSGKPIYEVEEDFVNSNGDRKWILTTKVPLVDKNGRITGLVGIGHDITTRRKNEEELIMARDKAEESDRLKTAFLHNISHEIRTPMNAIFGFSTILDEPDIDVPTRKSYLDIIVQSCNHLLSIVTDIVEMSNIEANIVKIEKKEINVNSTLNSICDQFLLKADEKKIKLTCISGLSDSDASVLTDNTKLTQILSNLINNAIKFTDNGYIKTECVKKDGFLEFSVTDTGIGIPKKSQKRIFDRFYKVQNDVSRIYEGTGLGLSISKSYIDILGGKIWLDSDTGKGSTFYFTIPYEKLIPVGAKSSEVKKVEKQEISIKKTILIAEDDETNFRLLKIYLSKANVEILWARNGEEAVEKCLPGVQIDLILMDIKMPGMDGYTATRIILESRPEIPVIAQTAYGDINNLANECGCVGIIFKPYNRQQLLSVIKNFL